MHRENELLEVGLSSHGVSLEHSGDAEQNVIPCSPSVSSISGIGMRTSGARATKGAFNCNSPLGTVVMYEKGVPFCCDLVIGATGTE
jgi:hypothetical protein